VSDDPNDLLNALRLLERSVRHETLIFEANVYHDPFVPKEQSESARVFAEHCKRLNEYLEVSSLRHFCWMRVPHGSEKVTSFLRFENGQATPTHYEMDLELLPERVLPLIDGRLWGLVSLGTPQYVGAGPKCVTSYVVLEDPEVAEILREGPNLKALAQLCSGLPDQWPSRFIMCDAVFATPTNKREIASTLLKARGDRKVHFEAYHVIAGLEPSRFAELARKPIVRRALALATMQFQREWGSRDQEVRTERALREAQLRQASDLLSTFDQVLHSGLNALRSIRAGLACQDFSSGTPPSGLSYRLVKNVPGLENAAVEFDEEMETHLLETLSRIWRGEEATAAALSLGRLLAHRRILNSMRSSEDVNLSVLVERACALLNSYAQGAQPPKPFSLDISDPSLRKGVLPSGYLGPALLSVLIYELLLNAYNHSLQPIDIRVRAKGGDEGVCLFIRSRVQDGREWVSRDGVALLASTVASRTACRSFLMRFADVEHVLNGGLSIMTKIVRDDGEWYEAELCMRSLDTEDGGVLHPRWLEVANE
jgi:signal transduction histidine kinase